jgi:undecaprenyl-diphosphatase
MEFIHSLDQQTLEWFTEFRHAHVRLTPVMKDISALGGRYVLAIVVLFTAGLLLSFRRYRTAGFVLAAALGGLLLSEAIKVSIGRERPPNEDPTAFHADASPSFPSGHSMLSATIYLTLALVATALIPRWPVRAYIVFASLLLVALIGITRLYLGVHYLTDVVAGWVAGLAWGLFCRWVESRWVLRLERRDAALQSAAEGHEST